MPEPQAQAQASGTVLAPDVIVKQIREQYPEYSDFDDKTLLSKMLGKHPDWRQGVPPNAKLATKEAAIGAQGAKAITGPRTWGESIRENLPAIGATVGGIVGMIPSLGVGEVPGAALGASVGTWGKNRIREAQGLEVPHGADAALEAAGSAAEGAISEFVGGKISKPVRRVLGGVYREAFQAGGVEAKAAREAAEKYGMRTTAAELAGKPDTLTRKLGNSGYLGLGRSIATEAQKDARQKAAGAIETSLLKFHSNLKPGAGPNTIPTPEVAGEVVQNGFELAKQVFQAEDNRLYREVDQALQALKKQVPVTSSVTSSVLGPDGKPVTRQVTEMVEKGLQVDLAPLKTFMQRQVESLGDVASTFRSLAGENKSLLSFNDALKKLPDTAEFEQANFLRSQLLSEIREIRNVLPGKFKGLEKQVEKILDRQMETAATNGGPQVMSAWRRANAFHADAARTFEDSIVGKLMRKEVNPENVFKKLGPDQVTDAKAIMQGFEKYLQYADPKEKVVLREAQDTFRQGYVAHVLGDLGKLQKGEAVDLKAWLRTAKPSLDAVLGNDPRSLAVRQDLMQVASFLDRQAKINGLSHWTLFEALGAAGAGMGMLSGAGAGAAALGSQAILAGAETLPWVLTKILYNPTATKFLLDGIVQLPKGTEAAGPAFVRAIRIALTPPGVHEESQKPAAKAPQRAPATAGVMP